MLARLPLYEAEIDNALKANQIPEWIKYLPLAESRLKAQAVSPAGAAGLWQIMPSTGRSLGLRITKNIDERLHTEKASMAAARYIKQLHQQFGDWLLALAAYNCGAGNVRKAQRRAKGYFYHEISRYLPRQTQRYIPRVLTIATIAGAPGEHGFESVRPQAKPIVIQCTQSTSLEELAAYYCCDKKQLSRFNPAFLNGNVRLEGSTTAAIYIPAGVYNNPFRISLLRIGNAIQPRQLQRAYELLPDQPTPIARLEKQNDNTPWKWLLAFTTATVPPIIDG